MNMPLWKQLLVAGGVALRMTARLVDRAAEEAQEVWQESKKAFLQELDPNVEDAHILEEKHRRLQEPSQEA